LEGRAFEILELGKGNPLYPYVEFVGLEQQALT
jgi:hypothetical protein